MKKITKNMGISEILEVKPKAVEILFEAGLGCIGCHFSHIETLEQGMKMHGFSDEEIDEIVDKLNKIELKDKGTKKK